jgi:hypothetical protein
MSYSSNSLRNESTLEGIVRPRRKNMKQFSRRQIQNRRIVSFYCFTACTLLFAFFQFGNAFVAEQNSPLLVMLQLVDPNALSGNEDPLDEVDVR